jgi:hypothetical protein
LGNYPEALAFIIDRLRGVVVENKPAMAVMAAHDGEETLHYADPPYLPETRRRSGRRADNGGVYRHELSDGDHAELLEFMKGLEGMVVLSGYPSELYDDTLAGWRRVTKETHADGASDRLEVLWLNPAIAQPASGRPVVRSACGMISMPNHEGSSDGVALHSPFNYLEVCAGVGGLGLGLLRGEGALCSRDTCGSHGRRLPGSGAYMG